MLPGGITKKEVEIILVVEVEIPDEKIPTLLEEFRDNIDSKADNEDLGSIVLFLTTYSNYDELTEL